MVANTLQNFRSLSKHKLIFCSCNSANLVYLFYLFIYLFYVKILYSACLWSICFRSTFPSCNHTRTQVPFNLWLSSSKILLLLSSQWDRERGKKWPICFIKPWSQSDIHHFHSHSTVRISHWPQLEAMEFGKYSLQLASHGPATPEGTWIMLCSMAVNLQRELKMNHASHYSCLWLAPSHTELGLPCILL